jgi:hypothetical protein
MFISPQRTQHKLKKRLADPFRSRDSSNGENMAAKPLLQYYCLICLCAAWLAPFRRSENQVANEASTSVQVGLATRIIQLMNYAVRYIWAAVRFYHFNPE